MRVPGGNPPITATTQVIFIPSLSTKWDTTVVFNDGHDGFAGFYEVREVRDSVVRAYYGSYPAMNRNHHILGIDPISGRGAYGDENNGVTPDGRWIVTKLDLLIAQATGYVLRDTSPCQASCPYRTSRWPTEAWEPSIRILLNVVGIASQLTTGRLIRGRCPMVCLSIHSLGTMSRDSPRVRDVRIHHPRYATIRREIPESCAP